jgi:alpha-L-rhamnosidase
MRAHSVDNIWNYKLQFGDWVALDAEEGSYFGATPNDLTCTAYYAYSTGLFAKMAAALGKAEAEEYEKLYSAIVKKFQDTFFDENGNMTAQTQTAHIVALYFHLVPEKYVEKTVEGLKRLLDKENGHLVTGFVGTPYFCHALSQNGCVKEAYDLLQKEDFPSWLYQVKKGATTIWEHWDGLKEDGTMWSADMNSFNHYAYGAIGEWMYRVMAGIEADEAQPGFRHAVIYPRIGGGLDFVEGSYHSIYGEIRVKWEVEGKDTILTVQIPANTTASIRLDQAEMVTETDGLSFVKKDSYMEAEAGSGSYRIQFQREG